MSHILFALSNITIPLLLLIYKTAVRVRKEGENGCGQWLCLILVIFLSNFLFYMASDSKIYLFGDLVIKLGICFLPISVNQKIQKKLSYMHLEILLQYIRSFLIEHFYGFYSFITTLALSKMDETQQSQFKQAIIAQLQTQTEGQQLQTKNKQQNSKLNVVYKHYDHIGITCDLLTPEMLQKYKNENKLKRHRSNDKFLPKPTGNSLQRDQQVQREVSSPQFNFIPINEDSAMKKKNSILIQRSSTDLGIQDRQQRPRMMSTTNGFQTKPKNQDMKKKQVKYPTAQKVAPKKQTVKQSQSPIQFEEEQPSMILNKLDVSEYSDMFEQEEQFQTQSRALQTKVQAIVEIGAGSSTRLQIYNIELYSNNQIRIMSLYGRQFEKHKLIAIHPQKHGYYELILEGGKVNKRRVKFRGKIDPFVRYLQPATKLG